MFNSLYWFNDYATYLTSTVSIGILSIDVDNDDIGRVVIGDKNTVIVRCFMWFNSVLIISLNKLKSIFLLQEFT